MRTFSEVEKLFIEEVLDTHGEYLVDLMQDAIIEQNLRLTDDLVNSLDYDVRRRGNDFVLEVSFLGYGRAIEIMQNKSRRLRAKQKLDEGNRHRSKNIRRAKAKDHRFYARNVYGSINRLLQRMASEYTDEEIARLKGILENRVN